jgi:hypothetical protein
MVLDRAGTSSTTSLSGASGLMPATVFAYRPIKGMVVIPWANTLRVKVAPTARAITLAKESEESCCRARMRSTIEALSARTSLRTTRSVAAGVTRPGRSSPGSSGPE